MTKQDVFDRVTKQTGLDPQTSRFVLEAFFEVVNDSLIEGQPIYVRTFGSFILKARARKVACNITQNTALMVEAHTIPYFKPGPAFAHQVKQRENSQISEKRP